ncbi:hypothetical protein RCL1_002364 [Eukaryota sp. TZLM3-RCL]
MNLQVSNLKGFTVATIQTAKLLPCFSIFQPSGSSSDPQDFPGLKHLSEHLLFRGPNKDKLYHEYDKLAITCNAHTSKEHMFIQSTCLPKFFNYTIKSLCDLYFRPCFKQEDTSAELAVVKEESKQLAHNSRESLLNSVENAVLPKAFKNSIIGDLEKLKNVNATNVIDFHLNSIKSTPPVFICIGDKSHEEVVRILSECLSNDHESIVKTEENVKNLDQNLLEFPSVDKSISLPASSELKSVLATLGPSWNSQEYSIIKSIMTSYNERSRDGSQLFYHPFRNFGGIFGLLFSENISRDEAILRFKSVLKGLSSNKGVKIINSAIRNDRFQVCDDSVALSEAVGRHLCFGSENHVFQSNFDLKNRDLKKYVQNLAQKFPNNHVYIKAE